MCVCLFACLYVSVCCCTCVYVFVRFCVYINIFVYICIYIYCDKRHVRPYEYLRLRLFETICIVQTQKHVETQQHVKTIRILETQKHAFACFRSHVFACVRVFSQVCTCVLGAMCPWEAMGPWAIYIYIYMSQLLFGWRACVV